MPKYEIVIRAHIVCESEDYPSDALIVSPIKEAIRDKVRIYQKTHHIDKIIEKVELILEEEPEDEFA